MNITNNQKDPLFFCENHSIYLTSAQLLSHLKLKAKHKISKKPNQLTPPDDFKFSMLEKINSIVIIQQEMQKASLTLLETINSNTISTISNYMSS